MLSLAAPLRSAGLHGGLRLNLRGNRGNILCLTSSSGPSLCQYQNIGYRYLTERGPWGVTTRGAASVQMPRVVRGPQWVPRRVQVDASPDQPTNYYYI
jgi:hypothetical protein